MSEDKGV